jgi:hypothetical protein
MIQARLFSGSNTCAGPPGVLGRTARRVTPNRESSRFLARWLVGLPPGAARLLGVRGLTPQVDEGGLVAGRVTGPARAGAWRPLGGAEFLGTGVETSGVIWVWVVSVVIACRSTGVRIWGVGAGQRDPASSLGGDGSAWLRVCDVAGAGRRVPESR